MPGLERLTQPQGFFSHWGKHETAYLSLVVRALGLDWSVSDSWGIWHTLLKRTESLTDLSVIPRVFDTPYWSSQRAWLICQWFLEYLTPYWSSQRAWLICQWFLGYLTHLIEAHRELDWSVSDSWGIWHTLLKRTESLTDMSVIPRVFDTPYWSSQRAWLICQWFLGYLTHLIEAHRELDWSVSDYWGIWHTLLKRTESLTDLSVIPGVFDTLLKLTESLTDLSVIPRVFDTPYWSSQRAWLICQWFL